MLCRDCQVFRESPVGIKLMTAYGRAISDQIGTTVCQDPCQEPSKLKLMHGDGEGRRCLQMLLVIASKRSLHHPDAQACWACDSVLSKLRLLVACQASRNSQPVNVAKVSVKSAN